MFLLLMLVFGVLFGFASSQIAKEKNRDTTSWFLIGFFFGIFGLITAALVPTMKN